MKWLILNKIDYLERYLEFNLKKRANDMFLYYKKKEDFQFIKPDRALLLTNYMDDSCNNFVREAAKNNTFLSIITESKLIEGESVYYVKDREHLLNNFYEDSKIPTEYMATDMHMAMPKMLNWISRCKKGVFKFLNKEVYQGDKFNSFFKTNKQLGSTHKDEPSQGTELSCPELEEKVSKVNIYCPTYYRFQKTKKSILSIIELSKNSKHDIQLYIGDNCTKLKEMKKWLRELDCSVYFSEENLGKAGIVNLIHTRARESDYIFSIDSDIYFDDREKKGYHPFDKMIEILEKCDNIGLVSSNQYDLSHHWYGRTVSVFSNRGFQLGKTSTGVGIAGGCLVMRTSDWESIGMYKENHDIYTGDDSILTYNVFRKLGKEAVVSHDFFMVHPETEEEEKDYAEWKNKSWERDNINFIKDNYKGSNTKGFFD